MKYDIITEYDFHYLGNLPTEKDKKSNEYFIMDITKYKQKLYVFPVHPTTSE